MLLFVAKCCIIQWIATLGGNMVSNTIRVSDEIMKAAVILAPLNSRSVPKQIEHWAKIGKIAEENPDLPYTFIKGVLEAKSEMEHGDVSPFEFRVE
jgi:hypothetical protein